MPRYDRAHGGSARPPAAPVLAPQAQALRAGLAPKRSARAGPRPRTSVRDGPEHSAAVPELCDLAVADLRLDQPAQVLLTGKGRKQRRVPLWPETVQVLQQYLSSRPQKQLPTQPVFLNSHGQALSRFGVGHLVRRYTTLAADSCPSLRKRRVSPHTFRHTTALNLVPHHCRSALLYSSATTLWADAS